MIHLETKVKLPFLWGKTAFKKDCWNQVNLIVGPNGSGKTLLAEELAKFFKKAGYQVDFLRSDRYEQESSLAVIKENAAVREKIESVISNMFGKSIRFEQLSDGSYVPIVENKTRGVEYNLREGECHGLKEILKLLVALYSHKKGCLIVDEPELHLHPQFQQFFMNEIRRTAEKEPSRVFFLITHSPYFIDLRFPEDLIGVVVCHVNRVPTHIENLDEKDEILFRKFLPRFNTYHKQFFFSDNQIFVEGYTDQQMFTNLLCCIEDNVGSAGTGIIDVGGKDELGVFFKVCTLLGTDGRIITDLDSLFCGKLRDMICEDERPQNWLEKQYEKQLPFFASLFSDKDIESKINLEKLIIRLERFLTAIGKHICSIDSKISLEVDLFVEKVKALCDKYEKPETLDTFKTVILMGVLDLNKELERMLPVSLAQTIVPVINLFRLILAASEAARVYILPKGCIEHFYTQNKVYYMPVSAKDRLFHAEFEFMINCTPQRLRKNYPTLVSILHRACLREV